MAQHLNLKKSYEAILKAARERRFISYGDLAKANGAPWNKVRYEMNRHLGELVKLAAERGWPMPSAIVVSQANVESGNLDGPSREGFVAAAKEFGYDVSDPADFVERQQQSMFEWAPTAPDDLDIDDDVMANPAVSIWIEKSLLKGRPDRASGPHRLGEALWSPQRAKNGGDFYANMRQVRPDDIVLHLTDNRGFTGISYAADKVDESFEGVSGTDWADQPGYRVQLRDFEPLAPELPREAFFKDAEIGPSLRALLETDEGHGLFYNRNLELNQGAYLSPAPRSLVALLNKAYRKIAGRNLVEIEEQSIRPGLRVVPKETPMHSLNTIFYGPPGTGKTYITARRAVEICDGQAPVGNEELRDRYSQLVKQKRIEFVTFHQTYGYEEFVEGLRPETGESEDGTSTAGFRLQHVDGVLKRIADRATRLPSGSGDQFDPSGRKVFKISLGRSNEPEDDYLREECFQNGYIPLAYGGNIDWSGPEFDSYEAIAN